MNVYGVISMNSKVNLHLFESNLANEDYIKILRDNLKDINQIGEKVLCFNETMI